MGGHAWTSEDIDYVRTRYEAGDDDYVIGAVLGRTKSSVASVRHDQKIRRPEATLKRASLWSQIDIATARRLYAEGWPNSVIAIAVRRSRIAIKRFITTLHLQRDPSSTPLPDIFDSESEQWRRSIVEIYAVSSCGSVMSLIPGHVGEHLQTWTDPDGYKHVTLRFEGRDKRFAVHSLVATAFHGLRPTPTHQAAHENGNPGDNRSGNLRWATPKENQGDRLKHGTASRGEGGRFTKSARGTADMVRQAEAARIPVLRIDPAAPACPGVGGRHADPR